MIHTKALVISAIKYAEADLIVTCYTLSDGMKTYMIRGVLKSRRGKFNAASFQPFTQLDIVARHRNKGALEYLSETKVAYPYQTLHTDMIKSSLVMFLAEVLKIVVREEEANPILFNFLEETFIQLDKADSVANYHIEFLLELSKHLGFYPDAFSEGSYFNMLDGVFQETATHAYCVDTPAVTVLKEVLVNEDYANLRLTREARKALLDLILTYYKLHVDGFRTPKSLAILEQLFK